MASGNDWHMAGKGSTATIEQTLGSDEPDELFMKGIKGKTAAALAEQRESLALQTAELSEKERKLEERLIAAERKEKELLAREAALKKREGNS